VQRFADLAIRVETSAIAGDDVAVRSDLPRQQRPPCSG
jgi:hypothetical protein